MQIPFFIPTQMKVWKPIKRSFLTSSGRFSSKKHSQKLTLFFIVSSLLLSLNLHKSQVILTIVAPALSGVRSRVKVTVVYKLYDN